MVILPAVATVVLLRELVLLQMEACVCHTEASLSDTRTVLTQGRPRFVLKANSEAMADKQPYSDITGIPDGVSTLTTRQGR